MPEFDISSSQNPDVSVYIRTAENMKPIIVIELCRTQAVNRETSKVQEMIIQNTTLTEGYVFDWEKFQLYRIGRNTSGKPDKKAVLDDKIRAVSLPVQKVIEHYNTFFNRK